MTYEGPRSEKIYLHNQDAPAWYFKMLHVHHQSVSILRIFYDVCHHGNLLSNFSYWILFVGVSHPRLEGNEAECLEVNRVDILDYSICVLSYNSVNRTHSKHFPQVSTAYVTSLSSKCEKCQRCKQRDYCGAKLPVRYVRTWEAMRDSREKSSLRANILSFKHYFEYTVAIWSFFVYTLFFL